MVAVQARAFAKGDRKHYLDNIRWGTVVLVLIYHVFLLVQYRWCPFLNCRRCGDTRL